jgi:Domain of unknown function (DUF4149)
VSAQLGQSARALSVGIGAPIASVILLSAWLGAALFFSVVAAPALFRVLPSRTLAGAVVGRTLPVVFVSGVVVGVIVALLAWRATPPAGVRLAVAGSAIGISVMCGIAQFGIGGRIAHLRASLGTTLESLPAGDPARAEFGRLHGLSVTSLGVAMLLAIVSLGALASHLSSTSPRD